MTLWQAVVFGVLQGLTEFLPVSSSGHLVLVGKILGQSTDFVFFSVLLHVATLFAVFFVLWKDIKFLILHPFSKPAKMLYFSTFFSVVIIILFKEFFENAFLGAFLPICFLITAILLCVTEFFSIKTAKKITYKTGAVVGLVQGLAVLPGISRSGATICAACLCGVDRNTASRFSFILSIPIILASIAYELFDVVVHSKAFFDVQLLPTILAFISAFLVGVLAVKFMLKTFQKIKLWWFSIYLVFIAIISLLFL